MSNCYVKILQHSTSRRFMAYNENAAKVAKMTDEKLRSLLNKLLSVVTGIVLLDNSDQSFRTRSFFLGFEVRIENFSKPTWAEEIGGAYPSSSLSFKIDAFDIENIGYMQGVYFSAKRAVREFTESKFS